MIGQRWKGFTLVELMAVLVIVELLLTLALPAYQRQLRDTRRSLGGAVLEEIRMRQEQYFLDYKRYAETLTDLGYPEDPYAINPRGDAVSSTADNRIYLISLSTMSYAYSLQATPQLSQTADDLCGSLIIDSKGLRRTTGSGGAWECWQ